MLRPVCDETAALTRDRSKRRGWCIVGFMDKRKVWREQEQLLVERWNAAAERFRDAQAALSSQSSRNGELAPDEESVLKAKAARAELEAMRKQVARIKAEFSAGKRY